MINKINSLIDNYLVKILVFSLFAIFIKWVMSYFFFDDNLNLKIFFDAKSDGFYYYPFIKYLAELTINPSFDPDIINLKNITIPIHTVLLNTLAFKLVGDISIIFLEFILLSIFIYIFYYFFLEIKLNKNLSIILSIVLFYFADLIQFQNLLDNIYLKNISFYNLRFPNKILTNLCLYIFIFLLIIFDKRNISINKFKKSDYLIFSLILAFSFGVYYYYFLVSVISFILFLFYKNNFSINFLIKDLRYLFYLFLLTIFFSIPVFLNIYFVESDFLQRLGIFELDLNKKKIILSYFISQLIRFDFLILFFLSLILTIYFNIKKYEGYRLLNIIFIVLLSSIIAPFVFFIVSNKSLFISPFLANIVFFIFVTFMFQFFIFSKNFLNYFFKRYSLLKFYCLLIVIFFIQSTYTYKNYQNKLQDETYISYRNDFSNITEQLIKIQKNSPEIEVLTYDRLLQIWLIMNDVKFIRPLSGQVVSKTHEMIENDIIQSFKFLSLDENDFKNFLKLKKKGLRYYNPNTQNYFWHRYTANSLQTFNDSKDFSDDIINDIKNTSITKHQQLGIPNFEFNRLLVKFKNYKLNKNYSPDIIILKNNYGNESDISFKIIKLPKTHCVKSKLNNMVLIVKKINNDCK